MDSTAKTRTPIPSLADYKHQSKSATMISVYDYPWVRGCTESVNAPTIGVDAGPHVNGQNLDAYGILKIFEKFAALTRQISKAPAARKQITAIP